MVRNSGKLRVAFLFDESLDKTDGVAQYVKTLGAWLSSHGHEVIYLVGATRMESWAGGKVYSLSKNLNVSWGGNKLSMSLIPKLKRIKQLINEEKIDIVHVQVPYSPFMAQVLINLLKDNTALVGTVHTYPPNRLTSLGTKALRVIYGKSLKRFDAMLSVSAAAQKYARQTLNVDSIIVPNMVELDKFRTGARRVRSKRKKIVFLGRLVKRKGCMELLRAFGAMSFKDVDLIVAGDGPLRSKLERYTVDNGLSERVKFLGYIEENDKPGLLAGADIACFPSLYGESFGIVLIEAMAAGSRIVVGGDNPGYKSVLGESPLQLVDPKNSKTFARRLDSLLTDGKKAASLHDWQEKEVAHYDVNVVAPRLVKLYLETIAKRARSGHN